MKKEGQQTCDILVWEVCDDDTDLLSSLIQSKQHRLWTYGKKSRVSGGCISACLAWFCDCSFLVGFFVCSVLVFFLFVCFPFFFFIEADASSFCPLQVEWWQTAAQNRGAVMILLHATDKADLLIPHMLPLGKIRKAHMFLPFYRMTVLSTFPNCSAWCFSGIGPWWAQQHTGSEYQSHGLFGPSKKCCSQNHLTHIQKLSSCWCCFLEHVIAQLGAFKSPGFEKHSPMFTLPEFAELAWNKPDPFNTFRNNSKADLWRCFLIALFLVSVYFLICLAPYQCL